MKKFLDKLSELITEDNGRLSHTKLWANIGNLVASLVFIYHVYKTETLDPELFLIYLSVLVLQRSVSKITDRKYANSDSKSLNL